MIGSNGVDSACCISIICFFFFFFFFLVGLQASELTCISSKPVGLEVNE